MPLEHLDLTEEEIEDELEDVLEEAPDDRTPEERLLDAEHAQAKKAKATAILIAPVADPVSEALAQLTAAVGSGSLEAIGAAQTAVENARLEQMRAHQRQSDLNYAATEAAKLKKAEATKKKLALADEVEAKLRRRSPLVKFEAPGRRLVTIRMTGLDLEVPVIQSVITRLAIAQSRALADQVVASRNAGKSIPVRDWLTSMINADDGLAGAIKLGVCKVTKLSPKRKTK